MYLKWVSSTGGLFLFVENWANDQSLYFDIVMFAVTTAVSQTDTEIQYLLWAVQMETEMFHVRHFSLITDFHIFIFLNPSRNIKHVMWTCNYSC